MASEGPKQLRTRSFQSNTQPPTTVAQIAAPRSVNDKNSEPQASKQIISSNNNLEIERCTFTGLSGVRYTFGGAIFARSANLFLLQDKFTDNIAVMGGGVASVNSPYTCILNCTFENNRGFVASGGLLSVNGGASAILTPQTSPKGTIRSYDYSSGLSSTSNFGPSTVFIQKCNFTECQSQYAGGFLFENQADVIIDNSRIENCYADMEGGGGGYTNSMVYIRNSIFYHNKCGLPNRVKRIVGQADGFPIVYLSPLYDTWFTKRKHLIPPGAPAFFYFTTIPPPDPSFSNSFAQIPQLELVTQHCCFFQNLHVDSSNYFSILSDKFGANTFPIYSIPKEILFAGYSIYRSYSDSFTDSSNSIFYAKGRLDIDSSFVLFICLIQIPNACRLENSAYAKRPYLQTSVIDPQSEALTFDEEASQASATSTISTPPTIDLPNQVNSTPITRTAKITISRLQSNTPSHSQSPTCSTGDFNSKETPRQTANIYITVFAYFYHPNLTTSPSVTSTGASWPIQTHVSLNSPTASTASGIIAIPQITISTATQSWHGEVPNPSFTPTCTFEHFPSQSAVATVTLLGDIWPNQTFYPNWTPTASTASGNEAVPHRSHSTVTHSYHGEIPNPSRTPTISFDKEPSRSLTASATSTGASWPKNSPTFPPRDPRSTMLRQPNPSQSKWGEIPNPSPTRSLSFAFDPSQSSFTETPSRSSLADPTTITLTEVGSRSITYTHSMLDIGSLTFSFGPQDSVTHSGIHLSWTKVMTSGEQWVMSKTDSVDCVVAIVPSATQSIWQTSTANSQTTSESKPNFVIIVAVAVVIALIGILCALAWHIHKTKSSVNTSGDLTDIQSQTCPDDVDPKIGNQRPRGFNLLDFAPGENAMEHPGIDHLSDEVYLGDTDDPFKSDFDEEEEVILESTTVLDPVVQSFEVPAHDDQSLNEPHLSQDACT